METVSLEPMFLPGTRQGKGVSPPSMGILSSTMTSKHSPAVTAEANSWEQCLFLHRAQHSFAPTKLLHEPACGQTQGILFLTGGREEL